MKHVECSRCIYNCFILKHTTYILLKPQTYANFSYQKKNDGKKGQILYITAAGVPAHCSNRVFERAYNHLSFYNQRLRLKKNVNTQKHV